MIPTHHYRIPSDIIQMKPVEPFHDLNGVGMQ